MALQGAFQAHSNTMLVATNGTANTASSQACVFPGSGGSAMGPSLPPMQALITNLSAYPIWVSITAAARVAAVPSAGSTTVEKPLLPNSTQVLSVPDSQGGVGGEGASSTTLYINTICPGAATQQLAVTFGEGL